jgi:glycerol uptake facilitator-like aquaporin
VTHLRRAAADGVGTALLLAAVVGSGIMGEKLAQGNAAIALLVAFGARSGAHFNPVVTLALALRGRFERSSVAAYLTAQFAGALAGVAAAHLMFDMPIVQHSAKGRSSPGLWFSEVVATFGLVLVVLSCDGKRPWAAPLAVSTYIAAAYWFTASTSFANPAVTLARAFTDTFAGIELSHVLPFIAAQIAGAALAVIVDRTWPPALT